VTGSGGTWIEPEALRGANGATGMRRIGKRKVDGAIFEIDGVEPEAANGS